jgi:hypothetical protein
MSAANPNSMEKSMVSVLVVANAGGGSPLPCVIEYRPAGNAYQALVDLPEDGSHPTFDGRDGKVDGTDGKSVVNAPQRTSAAETTAAASSQLPPDVAPDHLWHERLVREAIAAYIGTDPIKRGPENTFK